MSTSHGGRGTKRQASLGSLLNQLQINRNNEKRTIGLHAAAITQDEDVDILDGRAITEQTERTIDSNKNLRLISDFINILRVLSRFKRKVLVSPGVNLSDLTFHLLGDAAEFRGGQFIDHFFINKASISPVGDFTRNCRSTNIL